MYYIYIAHKYTNRQRKLSCYKIRYVAWRLGVERCRKWDANGSAYCVRVSSAGERGVVDKKTARQGVESTDESSN